MTVDHENSRKLGFGYSFTYLYGFSFLLLFFAMLPQVRGLLLVHGFRWLYIPAVSFLVVLFVTPIVRVFAFRTGSLDLPDTRKIHAKPTPLMGGVAIYLGFASAIILNNLYSPEIKGIALGATVIILIGMLDDIRDLSSRIKILGQLLACTIVVFSGVRLSFMPQTLWGDAFEIALTFIWIIGIANAMNFLDGMDGLATGLGVISSFFIGLVALQTNQPFLMFISLGLMGGCLGFLPYNLRPEKPALIFLGDAGSTFIGFTLACLGVMGQWDTQDPIKAFSMPVLILGVLLFDMTYTSVIRVSSGKVATIREWLDYVGRDHIHHQLTALGLSKRQTVFFIYLIAISLGISAVVLHNGSLLDALLLVLQSFNILFMMVILMQKGADNKAEKLNKIEKAD
jgi:UDP-GlcNAc:undecaprenyl-phosphate GlcNAc-1-phosphate transferase